MARRKKLPKYGPKPESRGPAGYSDPAKPDAARLQRRCRMSAALIVICFQCEAVPRKQKGVLLFKTSDFVSALFDGMRCFNAEAAADLELMIEEKLYMDLVRMEDGHMGVRENELRVYLRYLSEAASRFECLWDACPAMTSSDPDNPDDVSHNPQGYAEWLIKERWGMEPGSPHSWEMHLLDAIHAVEVRVIGLEPGETNSGVRATLVH